MKKSVIALGLVACAALSGCSSIPVVEQENSVLCRSYGFYMAMGESANAWDYEQELKRRIQSGEFTKANESSCQYSVREGADQARACAQQGENAGWCYVGARLRIKSGS